MNERSLANLERRAPAFEPGNSVAVKHGGQVAAVKLTPRASEIAAELAALVPASSSADGPAIAVLSMLLTRIEIVSGYIDANGIFDGRGRPRPVLQLLAAWERSAAAMLSALGMTPTARAKLGVDVARARGAALERHLAERYRYGTGGLSAGGTD